MASERLLTATPMCWILRIMALLLGKMRGTSLLLSPRNPGVSPPKENVGAERSRVSLRSLGGGLRSWLAVRGTCTAALNLTAPPLLRLAALFPHLRNGARSLPVPLDAIRLAPLLVAEPEGGVLRPP